MYWHRDKSSIHTCDIILLLLDIHFDCSSFNKNQKKKKSKIFVHWKIILSLSSYVQKKRRETQTFFHQYEQKAFETTLWNIRNKFHMNSMLLLACFVLFFFSSSYFIHSFILCFVIYTFRLILSILYARYKSIL